MMTNLHGPRRSSESLSATSSGNRPASDSGRLAGPVARPILLEPQLGLGDAGLDADGVVRACVRSLLGLAYRTPGFDVQIGLTGDPGWAVRLWHSPDGLRAQLVPQPLEDDAVLTQDAGRSLTPDPVALEAELALLFAAGV